MKTVTYKNNKKKDLVPDLSEKNKQTKNKGRELLLKAKLKTREDNQ